MVKRMKWMIAGVALLLGGPDRAEAISITLRPGTVLTAPAGGTVGWGYEIINDSLFWLSFDNINGLLTNPAYGDVDTSVFDLPVVDPGATLVLDYDPINALGLLELTLGALPAGTPIPGEVFGSYQIYNDAGLAQDAFQGSADWNVPFSAEVATQAAVVPEPGTWLLVASGVLALRRLRARRRIGDS